MAPAAVEGSRNDVFSTIPLESARKRQAYDEFGDSEEAEAEEEAEEVEGDKDNFCGVSSMSAFVEAPKTHPLNSGGAEMAVPSKPTSTVYKIKTQ